MREALLVGLICLIFALGAYRGTGEWGLFGALNLAVAAVALSLAAFRGLRQRRRKLAGSAALIDAVLISASILWGTVLLEGFASQTEMRIDLTYESRFELSPATIDALDRLPGRLTATLYADDLDPRARRSMLLLQQLERHADVEVRRRSVDQFPDEEDRYGIRSSNSVVLTVGERWERVDRLTEGALFEALSYLSYAGGPRPVLYVSTGAGEGDVENTGPLDFSGVAAALETEGIEVRLLSSPSVPRIPDDAAAILLLAPERRLHGTMLRALRAYLGDGGSLIALIDPGRETGLEELLADYGLSSPAGVIIDPLSGSVDGEAPGLNPIVSNYGEHDITEGLGRTRQTFFRGARTFILRKPQPDDRVHAVAFASGESWVSSDPDVLDGARAPQPPDGARRDYYPLVVAGRYPRGDTEARIVAYGDRDFATNRDLRSLYNLDLLMNGVHWAMRRDSGISVRPKAAQVTQFPVPIQNSLKAFYGIGLLVPQVLLVAGAWVWLKRRSA